MQFQCEGSDTSGCSPNSSQWVVSLKICFESVSCRIQSLNIVDLNITLFLRRFGLPCLGPLVFLFPKPFKLFDFQIFWLWASLRERQFNLKAGGGGYGFFLKKYSDFGGGKKLIIWFRVFVIYPNVEFWKKKKALCTPKKINILTLVLFEKKFWTKQKNHNPPPPLQVLWSVPDEGCCRNASCALHLIITCLILKMNKIINYNI